MVKQWLLIKKRVCFSLTDFEISYSSPEKAEQLGMINILKAIKKGSIPKTPLSDDLKARLLVVTEV